MFCFFHIFFAPDVCLRLDASRDLWLKIKPPPNFKDEDFVRSRVFMGESKNTVEDDEDNDTPISHKLKMNEDSFSPWSLLFESCDPKKTCRNVSKKIDAVIRRESFGFGSNLSFRHGKRPVRAPLFIWCLVLTRVNAMNGWRWHFSFGGRERRQSQALSSRDFSQPKTRGQIA
jgi:hypothetical protein